MSRDHTGCIRGFHHFGAAWYANSIPRPYDRVDQIMVGMYARPGGGTTGEFCIQWVLVSGVVPSPQLCAFNDSWHALSQFPDLLAAMAEADSKRLSPLEFCELLRMLDIQDLTERVKR